MRLPRLALLLLAFSLLGASSLPTLSAPPVRLPSSSTPSDPPAPSLSPTPSDPPTPSVSPIPSVSPSPLPVHVTHPRANSKSFQAGISLLLYGNDVSYKSESSLLFDQLAADNINSLIFVFPIYQNGYYGTRLYTDPVHTPSDAELAWLITSAQSRGFSVMLRPLIDEPSLHAPYGGWRGSIRPTSSSAWFTSYGALLVHYAKLAQANHVFALDIGSELNSMEVYNLQWPVLIKRLRVVYKGALTYSFNFDDYPRAFASLLDFVSVDAYYPVSSLSNPTVAQIIAGWRSRGLPNLLYRSALAHRPIVVSEVGVWPANGVFSHPYGGSTSPYNPLAQQHYYSATCTALKPSVAGIYWWEVTLTQPPTPLPGKPPSISKFNPLSVPGTDKVIAQCYAH